TPSVQHGSLEQLSSNFLRSFPGTLLSLLFRLRLQPSLAGCSHWREPLGDVPRPFIKGAPLQKNETKLAKKDPGAGRMDVANLDFILRHPIAGKEAGQLP